MCFPADVWATEELVTRHITACKSGNLAVKIQTPGLIKHMYVLWTQQGGSACRAFDLWFITLKHVLTNSYATCLNNIENKVRYIMAIDLDPNSPNFS